MSETKPAPGSRGQKREAPVEVALAEVEQARRAVLQQDRREYPLTGVFLEMFGEDREHLMALEEPGLSPARALPGILARLGYSVALEPLPEGKLAATDWQDRKVIVNPDPVWRIEPWSHHVAECLAHELGHIRLHGPGEIHPDQEWEAEHYALVFLYGRDSEALRCRLLMELCHE